MKKEWFFQQMDQFQLGKLPTERPHAHTIGLAELSQRDPAQALRRYIEADIMALEILEQEWAILNPLFSSIGECLNRGGRIYMAGCGATGRLVLGLEKNLRRTAPDGRPEVGEKIVSFMAGGDLALVHSLESFEDFQEYGARQLLELGYTSNDLFIGVTEGGETPFVIGATLKAAEISDGPVYFMYCNPTDILRNLTQRTNDVLSHRNVVPLSFPIGPMALAGSTRLQSCTVMQLALGGLFYEFDKNLESTKKALNETMAHVRQWDLDAMASLVIEEAQVYQQHGHVHFISDRACSLTVLTDTTERSPTFSLYPFENVRGPWRVPCWNYLSVEGTKIASQAWHAILGDRAARTLEWPELEGKASLKRLMGFDVSMSGLEKRRSYLPLRSSHKIFVVEQSGEQIGLGMEQRLCLVAKHPLARQTLLKMILNALSTIVMGRVGRYQSNIMTWVRPSNNKLIDRTIRNAQMLLEQDGRHVDYMELAHRVFELLPSMHNDRSLVLDLYHGVKK